MQIFFHWILCLVVVAVACVISPRADAAQNCVELARPDLFPHAVVQKTSDVPADARAGLPPYCEVTALISPVPGSKITAVYRLPQQWNGKLLGLGGNGWAGQLAVSLPPTITGPGRTASLGLPRGYATAQTDGGHPGTDVTDVSWMSGNPDAVTDFSHRAIHEMTVLGKLIVAQFYGQPAAKSYYQGCSTGGRMGLIEVQRYPEDYDGVVAGAPVYSLLVQSSSAVRDQFFKKPGAAIPGEQIKSLNASVLAACDAADGLKDGVVTDPRRCRWQPKVLACKPGDAADQCLTPAQIEAMNAAYTTVRTRDGVVGHYGLTRGSEANWAPILYTSPGTRFTLNGDIRGLAPLMFPGQAYDQKSFDIERQQAALHRTPFAAEYEATSADLSKFFVRGGKLILWHGLNDPGPSPFATIDYFERARKTSTANLRLYVAPGVGHCMGGPGADTFDPLTAMERWVETGEAPKTMIATNAAAGIERPLCEWPKLPYYRRGDPAKASSFACR